MLKLFRNLLGETEIIYDGSNNVIRFDYLKTLNNLQKNDGMHLPNKLRDKHINFHT